MDGLRGTFAGSLDLSGMIVREPDARVFHESTLEHRNIGTLVVDLPILKNHQNFGVIDFPDPVIACAFNLARQPQDCNGKGDPPNHRTEGFLRTGWTRYYVVPQILYF